MQRFLYPNKTERNRKRKAVLKRKLAPRMLWASSVKGTYVRSEHGPLKPK